MQHDVTILVPARDEQEQITDCLEGIRDACIEIGIDYEMLVIESGSIDSTVAKVQDFAEANQQTQILVVKEPGYGIALIRGIEASSGRFIVIFNVDFWDKRFLYLSKVDNLQYDIVNGSKLLPGSSDGRNVYRRLISKLFNRIFLRTLLGYNGTDTHGIKIMRREAILPIVGKCVTNSDIFDTELMIRAERAGLKILELPVNVREIRPTRFAGKRIWRIPMDILKLCAVLRPQGKERQEHHG